MIDLRSDTVTLPTESMREAMFNAEVGDDVYGDDPTINKLEKISAEIMGKESAMFVPSGTMGNQIAIMTHTNMGDEIILDKNSHIFVYEAGAYARLSGVTANAIDTDNICISPDEIELHIRELGNSHFPITSLVCFENPKINGKVVPLSNLKASYEYSKLKNLNVHMDGARIFNAAYTLGVEAKEIAKYTDSIMFCLSKGLCAPVGSMLCGTKEFIKEARRMRKILGGGMRQAGVLAACGIVAINEMIDNIFEDNQNAKYLGEKLNNILGIKPKMEDIDTNMVFVDIDLPDFDHDNYCNWMLDKGIKVYGRLNPTSNVYRFVTHHGIGKGEIDYFIEKLREYINN